LPIPTGELFNPRRMVQRSLADLSFRVHPPQIATVDVVAKLRPIVSRLQQIAIATGATTIDPVASVCNDLQCPEVNPDGQIIYRDAAHLNPAYVRDHVDYLDATVRRWDRPMFGRDAGPPPSQPNGS
jgi:hypothetical protein